MPGKKKGKFRAIGGIAEMLFGDFCTTLRKDLFQCSIPVTSGYLQPAHFSEEAGADVEKALKELMTIKRA